MLRNTLFVILVAFSFLILEKIESPCPPDTPGRYKVTAKAIDENEIVIGVGSKERYFPEK